MTKYFIALAMLLNIPIYAANFSRHEATKTIVDYTTYVEAAQLVKPRGLLKGHEFEYLTKEVLLLNQDISKTGEYDHNDKITLPIYKQSHKFFKGDLRNWYYAVEYGKMFGVSPAIMIAVRSHENPNNDGYAYGVVSQKGTSLSNQAYHGAKILKRLLRNPNSPTRSNLYHCALTYVGQGRASAEHWSSCVYTFYRRAIE